MYTIEAVIITKDLVPHITDHIVETKIIPLTDTLFLVPLARAHFEGITRTDPSILPGAYKLHTKLLEALKKLSNSGQIGYIEAECFGSCEQTALILKDGQMVFEEYGTPHAINAVLQRLGVVRTPDKDEFDTVQLGRYRSTDDWFSDPR